MASSDSHALVTIQRPDDRSTNRDTPVYPSMPSSAGITLSRNARYRHRWTRAAPGWWYSCVHDLPPLRGAASRRRRRPLHRPPTGCGNGRTGLSQGPSARTVIPTRTFESLDVVCFKTMWEALLGCPPLWHRLGPLDMPLEAKRFRPVPVAIPQSSCKPRHRRGACAIRVRSRSSGSSSVTNRASSTGRLPPMAVWPRLGYVGSVPRSNNDLYQDPVAGPFA